MTKKESYRVPAAAGEGSEAREAVGDVSRSADE